MRQTLACGVATTLLLVVGVTEPTMAYAVRGGYNPDEMLDSAVAESTYGVIVPSESIDDEKRLLGTSAIVTQVAVAVAAVTAVGESILIMREDAPSEATTGPDANDNAIRVGHTEESESPEEENPSKEDVVRNREA